MSKKYNAAIIGCGRIASGFDDDPLMVQNYGISTHAGAYSDNSDIDLVAASDTSIDQLNRFGKRWGTSKLYTDYRELLEKERIDVLSICTWNTTHLAILEEAAKRNVKAVFCEKPLSDSLANADQMVKIAQDKNIILFINHRRRWDDLYRKVREYIQKGRLGAIQQVSAYYTSGVANTCSHLFDVLRMLFGEVRTVNAWYKGDPKKDDPDLDGYLVMDSGATVTVQVLDARYYSLFEFDIYGTNGRLRIEDNGFKMSYWQLKPSASIPGLKALTKEKDPLEVLPKRIMVEAVENLVECLAGQSVPAATGLDGVKSLEIICAFHASAKAGNKTIALPLMDRTCSIKSK